MALDVIVGGLVQVLGKVRGLLFLPLVANTVGIEAYGAWAQVNGLTGLLVPVLGLCLSHAVVRFTASATGATARAIHRRASSAAFAVATIGCLVAGAFSSSVGPRLFGPRNGVALYLLALALVPPMVLARIDTAQLRTQHSVRGAYLADSTLTVASTALAAIAIVITHRVTALVVAVLVVYLGYSVVVRTLLARRARVPASGTDVPIREMLAFSLPTVPAAMADWALYLSDRFILGIYRDPATVGRYAAIYAVSQGLLVLVMPFELLLLPEASKLHDTGASAAAERLIFVFIRLVLLALVPAAVIVGFASSSLMSVLADGATGTEARTIAPILVGGIVVWGACRIAFQLLYVRRQSAAVARILGVAAIANLGITFALIPRLGAVGAAIATTVAYLLVFVATLRAIRLTRANYAELGRALVAIPGAAAMIAVGRLVPAGLSLPGLVPRIVVASLVYVTVTLLLRGVTIDELRSLARRR